MPIGYKYVKREADSYVNWAKIGSDMSNMIVKENEERENKKEALIQAARQDIETLTNFPTGLNTDVNGWMSKQANKAIEYRKLLEDKFKSGQLRYQDYIHAVQNLGDGYKGVFSAVKGANDWYKNTMDGIAKGDLSKSNLQVGAMIEGLGKITNSDLFLNTATGAVSVANTKIQKINGKDVRVMDTNPNNFMTVNEINNIMKTGFLKLKMDDELKVAVDNIGEKVSTVISPSTLSKMGTITKITDARLMDQLNDKERAEVKSFQSLAKGYVDAMYADPNKMASALFDYKSAAPNGKAYRVTYDKKDADNNEEAVYFERGDGFITPKPTEAQKKIIEDYALNRFYGMLDQKIEKTNVGQLGKWWDTEDTKKADKDKKDAETTTIIGTLWGGATGAQLKEATDYFQSINPSIKKVTRKATGVEVTYIDPDTKRMETRTISFRGDDGSLKTQEEFIISATPLLGGKDIDARSAIKRGGYLKNAKFNELGTATSESVIEKPSEKTKTKTVSNVQAVNEYLQANSSNIKSALEGGQDEAIEKISAIVSKFGVTLKPFGMFEGSGFYLTKGTGSNKKRISISTKTSYADDEYKALKGFIESSISPSEADKLVKGQIIPAPKSETEEPAPTE